MIASAGNDWSQASANCLFSTPGPDSAIYTVATVTAPGASASGRWEIALTAPYAGEDADGIAYQITKDFTALGVPILSIGDVDLAILINRANQIIEAQLTGITVQANGMPYLGRFSGNTGGAGFVDAITTTGLTTGILYSYDHVDEGVKFLRLNAGTDAPALPGKFRPLDYNASTNAKFWTQR